MRMDQPVVKVKTDPIRAGLRNIGDDCLATYPHRTRFARFPRRVSIARCDPSPQRAFSFVNNRVWKSDEPDEVLQFVKSIVLTGGFRAFGGCR